MSPKSRTAAAPARGAARATTMADLAELAGVSKITISRAFSGKGPVNEQTRARILKLAEKHGYTLNAAAQSLRLRRSHTVAVVVEMAPSASRPMYGAYPLEILGGIIQELSAQHFSALLTTRHGAALPGIRSADALILLGQGPHQDAVKSFDQLHLPMVVWGARPNRDRHVVVGSDNRQGGRLAAERLVAIGRRHPVFVGDLDHFEMEERHRGFADALAVHGITPKVVRSREFTIEAGHQVARDLRELRPRIDSIFAGSDLLAMGVIRGLIDLGQRIPEDVSVIGYDDIAIGASFIPPLTTIHQNWTDGGRLLARKALELVRGEAPASEMLPTFLVARGT